MDILENDKALEFLANKETTKHSYYLDREQEVEIILDKPVKAIYWYFENEYSKDNSLSIMCNNKDTCMYVADFFRYVMPFTYLNFMPEASIYMYPYRTIGYHDLVDEKKRSINSMMMDKIKIKFSKEYTGHIYVILQHQKLIRVCLLIIFIIG